MTPRREARLDAAGDIVLLQEQDRTLWNRKQIDEALKLIPEPLGAVPGPFGLQAAIAAVHCRAARAEDTAWRQILRLYDLARRCAGFPGGIAKSSGWRWRWWRGPRQVWR